MMSRFLQDAAIELLRREMARHIESGRDIGDAFYFALNEIQRQIHGSNPALQAQLIDEVVKSVAYMRQHETMH